MPINLQSSANFWARIKGDSASAGDGTVNTSPARYDTWNSDLGSQDDVAASSDTGTFSLVALFKRLLNTKLPTLVSGRLPVDGSGVTQPVSGTITANLGTISTAATESTLSTLNGKIPASLTVSSTRLLVDGSGVTQPVSGTVTVSGNVGLTGLATDGSTSAALVTTSRLSNLVAATQLVRPANTTAYTAGQALSNSTTAPTAITVANPAISSGRGGRIERVLCKTSQTTMTGVIRAYIYRGAVAPTGTNDGSTLTATQTNLVGWLDFSGFNDGVAEGTLSCFSPMAFVTTGANNLYLLFKVLNAFTPASGQTFDFDFYIDQI